MLLSELSKLVKAADPAAAIELARETLLLDNRSLRAKRLALLLAEYGAIDEPIALLRELPREDIQPPERKRYERLQGLARLRSALDVPARVAQQYEPLPRRVLYVAASAMPVHLSGYTRRTQALVRETRKCDWDVQLVTRPGYPHDRSDRLPEDRAREMPIEGIEPIALEGLSLTSSPIDRWMSVAAAAIEEKARELRPALIHAASNWQNALPALIAARRLGVPFVYEVRGFWDLTRVSRQPAWSQSEEHKLFMGAETVIARECDRLVTLSPRVAQACVHLGADANRINLVPNGSDMAFAPTEQMPKWRAALGLNPKAFVIGYAGSLSHLEGIADLVRATALIAEHGTDVQTVIAGVGTCRDAAERLAAELGAASRVKFLGAVPPQISEHLLRAADVVALPREAFAVTELVEPLKPIEALAVGRPLVMSSVAPLRDISEASGAALLHRPGDPRDLADKLLALARDGDLRAKLARDGRKFFEAGRQWSQIARNLSAAWDAVLADSQSERARVP